MLAFLTNLGLTELLVILVIAVLIFGKDLPQAASKAYMQARKLRNAVDDLRRDSGIERELREIERNVREAEWEARKVHRMPASPPASVESRPYVRPVPPPIPDPGPQAPVELAPASEAQAPEMPAPETTAPEPEAPEPPRSEPGGAASSETS
jgi:Sec-independent protein translocase protein TatA